MSDLHRAVEAELQAYRPDRAPAFAALKARKRQRDQRRAGAAVTLSVIAVAGIAFVPNALGSGSGGSQGVAGPQPKEAEPTRSEPDDALSIAFRVTYSDPAAYDGRSDDARLSPCLALQGVGSPLDPFFTRPPSYTVTVKGGGQVEAFRTCLAGLTNISVQELPSPEGPSG